MADVRRDKDGKPVRARKQAARPVKPKKLATLKPEHLLQVSRLYGLVQLKEIELVALQNHYLTMTDELAQKYNLPPQYSINFDTGVVTELGAQDA